MRFLSLLIASSIVAALTASPGDTIIIPGWHLQSTIHTTTNLTKLGLPGADITGWYRIGSRATVMAGLLENGVYDEFELFYSDNLKDIAPTMFQSPWLYCEELNIEPPPKGQHIFLVTHGIASKADIFLNGVEIVSHITQQGSFVGKSYDITKHVQTGPTILLIQAHPTNYLRDFAQGFVDWNPYPPDNGTGVWRNIEIKHTGPVSLSRPRVLTDINREADTATITINVDVENHERFTINGILQGVIMSNDGLKSFPLFTEFQLGPSKKTNVSMEVIVKKPEIWWPALWGNQPLYTVHMNVSDAQGQISDIAAPRQFGIRKVTSKVNSHNDTEFSVNEYRFRVRGAGYSPDMFLRFDVERVRTIFQYMLDMGLNTVRLEGKQEHPELYELADRVGLMVISGWECCDKWEAWEHVEDAKGDKWSGEDYAVAQASMLHEAEMMQTHPSMLAFLVGSDFWPDDRATKIYIDALRRMDWPNPVIASASKRGYPQQLGPSGMKMDGPYDWVPPNYWSADKLGAAFGFGSEQGAGVGTPEMASLKRFLSPEDLDILWTQPEKGMYHMSQSDSSFHNRSIYNQALFARYGPPSSLEDYVRKAQIMDYEATRAEFEGFATHQSAPRPATGVIYWMLNSAWPNLHWQLFDYYLRPAASYFGTKVGARREHVAYDYQDRTVYLINHSLHQTGERVVLVDLIDTNGQSIVRKNVTAQTTPNASEQVMKVTETENIRDVGFLRLILQDPKTGVVLSRNVYWLSAQNDVLDWDNSTWFTTPVTDYADFTALSRMSTASIVSHMRLLDKVDGLTRTEVTLENVANIPAFFLHLSLVDQKTHEDLTPVYWSENYITIFPHEKMTLTVDLAEKGWMAVVSGSNVERSVIGQLDGN